MNSARSTSSWIASTKCAPCPARHGVTGVRVPGTRRGFELMAVAFARQEDFNRRLDIRQRRLEESVAAVTQTVDRSAEEVAELRADRELAVEYLKAAMESLDDPNDRAAGLLALRTVAEAYGGLGVVAVEAGISRESLYRTLSPKGNPTLKTLLAVLKTVGLRLSVEPESHAHA